jgi:outer membrane protein assembly factor BamA
MAPLLLAVWLAAGQVAPSDRPDTIVAVQVHGNHTTPDADVLRLAGISVGQAFSDDLALDVAARLRDSGRFRRVDVRKRYGSLDDPTAVVLVILVEEQAGVSIDEPAPGPLRRLKAGTMWLPILGFEDGYGFTYGSRFSFVDVLGARTRLSVPLSWGGERRAAIEVERRFERGPLSRIEAGGGVTQREDPGLDIPDRRTGVAARAERVLAPWLRVGARTSAADVRFGDEEDRLGILGADVVVDTRRDPVFPRNAVFASAAWERLWFDRGSDTSRLRAEVRGYLGLAPKLVLVVGGRHGRSVDPLPLYEQELLGGSSLRGFRLGFRRGDRILTGSAELRIPFTSPLRVARTGVAVFADAGTAYGARERLDRARWDRSVGAGLFATAAMLTARMDVARGIGSGTRVHWSLGVTF